MRNQGVRWRHRLRTGAGRPNTTLASSNPSIRRFSMLPPPDCFQQQVIMHERNFGFATKPHNSNLRNHQEDAPEDYVAIGCLAANTVGGYKILVKFTCSAEASTFRHASTATLWQYWHYARSSAGISELLCAVPTASSKKFCAPSWKFGECTRHRRILQDG